MLTRNRTFFLAIVLAVGFSFFRGAFDSQPVSSPMDEKQYRYTTLDNGLSVLLISDEKADHGAASLDVNVGSLQNPEGREGLAHFLEHMLFLGTEKYPEAGEYQSFLSQHGGNHNAFTASEHTNYFFQIDPDHLDGALDRFSRFFYQPLFTEEYVQREKEAVHSEYTAKYLDDSRRIYSVYKAISNPKHPASAFAVGSLETLSDDSGDGRPVRDALIEFYERYYSSNLMTLVVYGPQSLNTLDNWVKTYFDELPNRNAEIDPYPESIFPKTPIDIAIKAHKTLYQLNFSFELGDGFDDYSSKPTQYIGHLLGHEGEGSLLALLKQEGLADGLSAGLQAQIKNNTLFQISVSLTPKGLENIDFISQQLFAYIRLIEEKGINKRIYEELRVLADLDFTFAEGQAPSRLVQNLSMNMHKYPVEDILKGPYAWHDFKPKLIKKALAKMTPQNTVRALITPNVESDIQDPWYETPYKVSEISEQTVTNWQQSELHKNLHIPEPNPFIPQDLTIQDTPSKKAPALIKETEQLSAWHLADTQFNNPQSSIYIALRSELGQQSAQNQVLIEAWVELLNRHLNSFSYPALLAGQEYRLYSHMRGISIQLYGYRDKQDKVLERVIEAINTYEPTEAQWQDVQDRLVRDYQNALKQKPFRRSIAQLNQSLMLPSFDERRLASAIQSVNFEDLNAIIKQYPQALEAEILAYGNISVLQLNDTLELIEERLIKQSLPASVVHKKVRALNSGVEKEEIDAQHSDKAMTLYLQAQTDELEERAIQGLIGQIIKAPYYTYMRTEQKYGYVVFATPYPMLTQGGLVFIVQSPNTSADVLYQETQDFLTRFEKTLSTMSEQDFHAHKQGLLNNLLQKPKNLKEKGSDLWSDLDIGNLEFNTKQQLADYIEGFSQKDVLEYYREHIIGNEQRGLLLSYNGQ